jgi:hypothetical protein
VASLLTVWSHGLNQDRGSVEDARLHQNVEIAASYQRFLIVPFALVAVGFGQIAKDLGSLREMPSFALSRRQRGFESRWRHKIKSPLTRPNAPHTARYRCSAARSSTSIPALIRSPETTEEPPPSSGATAAGQTEVSSTYRNHCRP